MWPRTRVVALQDFYNFHTATFFDRKHSGSNHGQRLGSLLPPPFRVPDRPEYNRRIPQVLPRSHRSPRRAPQPLGLFPVQSIVIRQTNCKTRLPDIDVF